MLSEWKLPSKCRGDLQNTKALSGPPNVLSYPAAAGPTPFLFLGKMLQIQICDFALITS